MKQTINIKPFSINKAWVGRRFKTPDYKQWRQDFGMLCKKEMTKGEVEIDYVFYLKHYKTSDVSNMIKTCEDALVENGVIEDDRFCIRFSAEKRPCKNALDERIEICIKCIYEH